AVKVLKDRWHKHLAVATAFQRHARVQAKLHHHSLASGIDIGQAGGAPYFVLEHLEGDTLRSRLRTRGPFEAAETVRVLAALLELLEYVHAQKQVLGHVHPRRVLLGDSGEVWLTGLGPALPAVSLWPEDHAEELSVLPPETGKDPE